MTPLLILLHAALLGGFQVFVRPGICEELDEAIPVHRFIGNTLTILLLANIGALAVATRNLLGY